MGGRNARALLLERSRAVLSDARSTQIYASVPSGWEQRASFGSLAGQKLAAKSRVVPSLKAQLQALRVSSNP